MLQALSLATKGLYSTDPNPRVGCVIVNQDRVVGEGWHPKAGDPHAEIFALRSADKLARGATAYVTLEPCCHYGRTPPCTLALIQAGIARVVAAMEDPNPLVAGKGLSQLREAGITTEVGVCHAQATELNQGFISRVTRQRPWIRAKIAMSLDGRITSASGESQWITGPLARQDGHLWRARSSAIMTGIGTVIADNPRLNVRLDPDRLIAASEEAIRQPQRIVLDPTLASTPTLNIFQPPGQTLIVTHINDQDRLALFQEKGISIISIAGKGQTLDLSQTLTALCAHDQDLNEIHLEAGAALTGAMLEAGLIDELILYIAPKLLGDRGKGVFHLPHLEFLNQAIPLKLHDISLIGEDVRMRFLMRCL